MSFTHPPTVADAVAAATKRLTEAGCASPEDDAALIVSHALGVERRSLSGMSAEKITASAAEAIATAVERRADHEPLAYVTGRTTFRGVELFVDSRVLVPVADTARLVDFAVVLDHGARVHDVGTGCGAIALAIKNERPDLQVSGSDISHAAIDVARMNAERLGLEVKFFAGRGLPEAEYDLVVANLPYVDEREEAMPLPRGTREHQPSIAVFAGGDGLDAIRELFEALTSGTRVAVEHAPSQTVTVRALLRDPDTRPDLSGHERFTAGRVP
jgi:release factor glutamine methyltransferase